MTSPAENDYSFDQLSGMDYLDVGAMLALYKIELSGEDFYNALAQKVDNEAAVALLRRNGREEAGHARRLARAIVLKAGAEAKPSPEGIKRPELPLPGRVDRKYLQFLSDAELSGDVTYRRWAANEPDPAVARLLRLNGREESLHSRRVEEAMTALGV
jgi:hypothetical protein